jgi:hypothetical protein
MNIQYLVRLLKSTGYSEDEVQIWVQKKDDEHSGRLYKVPTLIEGILHLLSEEGEVLEIGPRVWTCACLQHHDSQG